jgi:PEP-CTERM motif
MKSKLFARLGLSGLALVGLVSSAAADVNQRIPGIVAVFFTGTVFSSADPNGVFGCTVLCSQADNPFEGYTYTATYFFNYLSDDFYGIGESQIGLEGGSEDYPLLTSPLIRDSATISSGQFNHTYSIDPSQNGVLLMTTNAGLDFDKSGAFPYTLVAKVSDGSGDEIYSTAQSSSLPFALNQDFGPLSGAGYSEITLGCNGSCSDFVFADLTVTLKFMPGVPEPSTWILMMIGFAGVGYVGYRKVNGGRSVLAA